LRKMKTESKEEVEKIFAEKASRLEKDEDRE